MSLSLDARYAAPENPQDMRWVMPYAHTDVALDDPGPTAALIADVAAAYGSSPDYDDAAANRAAALVVEHDLMGTGDDGSARPGQRRGLPGFLAHRHRHGGGRPA